MENIKIEATIKAPTERVWEYYTNPDHIKKWNFAADDWHCPKAENDLKSGGKYCARMEAKDGSFGFDFEAVYDQVEPQQKLDYTIADGRKVKQNFYPKNNETQLAIFFEPETQNPIEIQREGWQAILNNFKKYVENNSD